MEKQVLLDQLLKLAEKEQQQGNKSITKDKLDKLSKYIISQQQPHYNQGNRANNSIIPSSNVTKESSSTFTINKHHIATPPPLRSEFSPLFDKYKLPITNPSPPKRLVKTSRIKTVENILISILETMANILDNLHLFSKLPMFPRKLLGLLKQTNKMWILLLIFLIRKTISQLMNIVKKENKIKRELDILHNIKPHGDDNRMIKKYKKIMKDLKFDKSMLVLELLGNVLDLMFNIIELSGIIVPDWIMNSLNFTSMFMTIYRMNKDDEYVDDDITDDLI